jgi:predicted metal-binding protein
MNRRHAVTSNMRGLVRQTMRSIILCETCKFSADAKTGPDGRTGGAILIDHVRDALAVAKRDDVVVETQACLWNCTRFCSVVIRDDARFSYVTGGHEPTRAQAEAIVAWHDLHGQTEKGEVPFRTWPDRMRGHFIARIPPVPK